MPAAEIEPTKGHHPQIFPDDVAGQQVLYSIEKENHWLEDLLARLARAIQGIGNRRK
jgi:IS1 family transposase